jgi:nitroreductase
MEFFETVEKRRSVRKFSSQPVGDDVVSEALRAATLAPNSSNVQTWDFHWVKNSDKKSRLAAACLSQSAARTAQHLVVVTADFRHWRRSRDRLLRWAQESKAHPSVVTYYRKIVPFAYSPGFLNAWAPVKALLFFALGLRRPMMRGPLTARDLDEVAIKSAALAAGNFVLAVTAQGADTCMMEGFDAWRVRRLLRLPCSTRIVMVIGIGYRDPAGVWGERFRLPIEEVVHVHN